MAVPRMRRFLWTVGLGTAAFSMQDIILEPYGGQVLGLDVSWTSSLTALTAGGCLLAFLISARLSARGLDTCRLAGLGAGRRSHCSDGFRPVFHALAEPPEPAPVAFP